MKKIYYFLIALFMVLSLSGCAKCISKEEVVREVEIVDNYHRASYLTPTYNYTTKTYNYVSHPPIYRIYVKHDGVEYSVSGSSTYDRYKDKIGETANAGFLLKKYDDGSQKYFILKLE